MCPKLYVLFYFKRETKKPYSLLHFIIICHILSDLFYNITSPFILIHVHASLCIIIINSRHTDIGLQKWYLINFFVN